MNTDTEKEVYGVIYVIENKVNGKKYVGQTVKNIKQRMSEHVRSSKKMPYKSHLHNAIKKYGSDCFDIRIIAEANSKQQLDNLEMYWIAKYRRDGSVYNIAPGGSGNGSGLDNPMYGKRQSIETRKKISKANTGKTKNKYVRKKLSKAMTGKMVGDKHPLYGVSSDYRKMVTCIDTEEVFASLSEASDKYNISVSCISSACNGHQKTAGGYKWSYCNEQPNKEHKKKSSENLLDGKIRKVINLDTKEIFNSTGEAGEKYGVSHKTIWRACKGQRLTACGYKWAYYNDYIDGEIIVRTAKHKIKVINIDTKEVFNSISLASKNLGFTTAGSIAKCCKGTQKTAGGYRWQYYEDYLEEQERKEAV